MAEKLKTFILFLLLTASCQLSEKQIIEGKVIGVSDGDTIKILLNGNPEKVRLYGIDAPERSQPYGKKALEFTAGKVAGKIVRIIIHGKDQYERILGEVILEDGKSLNEELLRNGYAWKYKYSENLQYEIMEADARKKKAGLWKDPNPIAPWLFRKQKNSFLKDAA